MKKRNKNAYRITYLCSVFMLSSTIGLVSYKLCEIGENIKPVTEELTLLNHNEPIFIDAAKIMEDKEEVIENNDIELFAYFGDMYDPDSNTYITSEELLEDGNFEVTTGNQTYEYLSDEDYDFFTAVVAAESNGNRHDALAVASSILNRCDRDDWVEEVDKLGMDGTNPICQIKAPGQYQVYEEGKYLKYLNNVSIEVEDACNSAIYEGIRNNNYCSFRSNDTVSYSDNLIVEGGNRFDDIGKYR